MAAETLTRGEAHDVIERALCLTEQGALDYLRRLQKHWIGHDEVHAEDTAETLAEFLHGYVDECAFNGDDERSNGPKPGDDTGLVAL